jgi:GT2 family glycosyltransferase
VPTVSAIVVSFSDPSATRRSIQSLLAQAEPPVEILVLDNHPDALTAAAMRDWPETGQLRLLHSGVNIGYAAACNRAAVEARGDWLFFLNPDAHADPNCLRQLLGAARPGVGVIGAQVLLPDGRTNAGDNPLHLTGIGWAGRFGQPAEHGRPRDVAAVSGAALLARAGAYRALGGLCERFFMYYDDADLCWRMRLAGWEVVFCPDAMVWHDFEFDRGARKWYLLERNRLWAVLSNYSPAGLALVAPLLIGTEVAVAGFALRGGWAGGLLRAWGSTLWSLVELRRWRRAVQASRRVGDSEIVRLMSGRFETSLVQSSLAARLNPLVAFYQRAMQSLLRLMGA